MAQMPSKAMGMDRKRSRTEISDDNEPPAKQRADESQTGTPIAQYPTTIREDDSSDLDTVPNSDYSTEEDNDDLADIEPLDDTSFDALSLDDLLSRAMISGDFIYLSQKYLYNTQNLYRNNAWVYDRYPNEQMDMVLTGDIYSQINGAKDDPFIPCIAKIVVPPDTRVAIVGDIHAEVDTIEDILSSLRSRRFIDDFLCIPNNARIIFLGDYTDRGGDSMEVLRDILILAVKNPGQVFLLRGNHETIYSNIDYGILEEIKKFEPYNTNIQNILMQKLAKIYEFMPVAMLLGFSGQKQTPFYFLAHGGPDIRYDYTDLLNLNATEYANNGGLCFWNLTKSDLIKTQKLNQLLVAIKKAISNDQDALSALNLHCDQNLTYGFLWNDIYLTKLKVQNPINKSDRGSTTISLSLGFIKFFLESFTNENVKIVGLIRGHQHRLAKNVVGLDDFKKLSPACCCFASPRLNIPILKTGVPVILDNTFSITTIISGPIEVGNIRINYLPTFLDLKFMGNNTWQFEAVN
jgi:hypothetical protein